MEKRAEQTKNRRLVDDSENRFFFADFLLQKEREISRTRNNTYFNFFPIPSPDFFAFSFCISAYSNLPSSSCAQVNHEGFPDKRKMAQVLTREVDWELRNFYLDSIDQCFRMMEYQVTSYVDKCFAAKRIIDCLAEIASLNCSDWDGDRVMV